MTGTFMQQEIRSALDALLSGRSLDQETVRAATGAIMDGRCEPVEVSAFLTALAMQGETETEIAGAAAAMRERSARIVSSRSGLLDTCGTGGDKLHTFNISTAAAIVVAATGQPVAKHGNRSVSSSSGSADVLEALGVNIDLNADQAGRCLDELGICFCYARLCHQAMKHVAPIRAALGFRTIFNLLGPLTNPARAEYQLIGVSRDEIGRRMAGACARLGTRRTLIVCGNNQLDEVALWGTTRVWDIADNEVTEREWTADSFGLPECLPDDLKVHSADQSAEIIRRLLDGAAGPALNIVLANAAAALKCRGAIDDLHDGVKRARQAVSTGLASGKLAQLADWTQRHVETAP